MVSRIQDDISSRYKTLELTLKDKVNDIIYIYDDLTKRQHYNVKQNRNYFFIHKKN